MQDFSLCLGGGFGWVTAEAAAVGAGGDAGVALEELAEEGSVLVADGVSDLPHGATVAFEEALGCGYAQFLQIVQRGVSGSLFKAANEIAKAHADVAGRGLQREGFAKILVEPFLRGGNGVIGMLGLQRNDGEAGLPCARCFDEQGLGGLHGNVVTDVIQ